MRTRVKTRIRDLKAKFEFFSRLSINRQEILFDG